MADDESLASHLKSHIKGTTLHNGNLAEIVNGADLDRCTVKTVMEALEARYTTNNNLREHTDLIKDLIDSALMDRICSEEDAKLAKKLQEEELQSTRRVSRQRPTKKARTTKLASPRKASSSGFNKPMLLSEALSELVGGEKLVDT